MFCPTCGSENPDDSRTCSMCGRQLPERSALADSPESKTIVHAGFWRRFAAHLIDTALVTTVGLGGGMIAGLILGSAFITPQGSSSKEIEAASFMAGITISLFTAIVSWLYFTLMESSPKQATLGKMAMGIVVTDMNADRISFGKANARYWAKLLSSLILSIGYIMAAFTERKQALHDIIAGTLVMRK